MLDSLGPISDRDNENLSTIDGGIVLLRKMLLEDIAKVKQGKDPRAVFRDPTQNQQLVVAASYKWITEEERAAILNREFEFA